MKPARNKGAALITVLVALLIISLMVLELQYNAMVERKLALNELNQVQAYYLAKAGARIGVLRVALFSRVKRSPDIKKLAGTANIDQYFDLIWNIPLPGFPPSANALGKLNKEDKDSAQKALEETKISDGQFSQVITSEGSKINLNYLVFPATKQNTPPNLTMPPTNLLEYNAMLLINLINQFIRESDNPAEEYGNLKPEEVVMDIMDWVNPGNSRFAGGNKDAYYEAQKPPYKAKKGPFFSLDEVRLVKGMDEHLFNKLKPYITVYSDQGKINLNNANDTMLKAIYPDFTEYDLRRLSEEKTKNGGFWSTETQFVDFITTTLGRSGFKTMYPKPADYPFTINNYSFVVDAMGILQKSKAMIQRRIKVAVSLVQGKGAELIPGVADMATCQKDANAFWYNLYNQCYTRPRSDSECLTLGGGWKADSADGNKEKCFINNQPAVAPPGGGSGSGAVQKPQDPSALKILYWIET